MDRRAVDVISLMRVALAADLGLRDDAPELDELIHWTRRFAARLFQVQLHGWGEVRATVKDRRCTEVVAAETDKPEMFRDKRA